MLTVSGEDADLRREFLDEVRAHRSR